MVMCYLVKLFIKLFEQQTYQLEQIKIGRTYVSDSHSRLPEIAFASTRTAKNVP